MPNNLKIDINGNGLKIAIVSARFNEVVTRQLMLGAVETLDRYGVDDDDISIAWVPGSFELPVVAKAFAESGKYDAIICLGAVIRGETDHYNMVANQSASGIASVGRETGVPTIFGVLTTENMDQAINRSGGKSGNLGSNSAVAAVETALLIKSIRSDQ
ncbi:MAG: 6,7-dimethyl-8-ribityllumazine synthase [Chloroflexota bacterium]|nr:6,7-dimethyl-8-ribityllumazine synthase [Chloroflexota bacterium]